jgi:hypothetical protein
MPGPIGGLETSVRNYHYMLRNIPEDHRSQGDMNTLVTLKLGSLEMFSFQNGQRQAPYISIKSVSPFASLLEPIVGFSLREIYFPPISNNNMMVIQILKRWRQ